MEKDTGSALLVLVRWAPGLQQSILAFCLLSMPEISLCLFFFFFCLSQKLQMKIRWGFLCYSAPEN